MNVTPTASSKLLSGDGNHIWTTLATSCSCLIVECDIRKKQLDVVSVLQHVVGVRAFKVLKGFPLWLVTTSTTLSL